MSGITLQAIGGSLVIDVPDEQTLIGRGAFLQVTDKRVSRSHALLDVIERKLYITPTHTNPCFLRKNGSKEHSTMTKDNKTLLNHGDAFGLLPDQLYFLVSYPQMNGKKEAEKHDGKEQENEDTEEKNDTGKLSLSAEKDETEASHKDIEKPTPESNLGEDVKETTKDEVKDEAEEETKEHENEEVETPAGNMALPLEKKRPLPEWMMKASDASPVKAKPSPKKTTAVAVSKREPGEKLTKHEDKEEDVDEEDDDNDEEEEHLPTKTQHTKASRDSDEGEDFDNDVSDDDYVPEASPSRSKGKKRQRRKDSDSEEDFSDDDDDDDYAPSKKKSKTPKKSQKGKGRKAGKGRQTPSRSAKRATSRGSRKTYSDEDDDDDEEIRVPRGRRANNSTDDTGSSRRPQRAARQKRGSYVDDPMVEEALEDFASEKSEEDLNKDKDSDFDVNEALDSGSDWEKRNAKQKGAKVQKVTKSPKSVSKKGKKKTPRRQSKSRSYSDDDEDEDELEDDEPYVPRPSKRRGGGASQESGESEEDKKKKRRREPCQYGRKCYRKNPVHFRTYCHPGDSSYDEDDKDTSTVKDSSKKATKDNSRNSPEKPSRPQRTTAGTRLVTPGSVDDDMPDTYDYNDSFIDDGTQPSDDSGQDSDYNANVDARGTARDAKKFLKNKKTANPVGSD